MVLIKCHGAYYFRTDTQKGIRNYEMTVKAPSIDYFQEHTQKYIGTDDNGKPMFSERNFLNVRGRLKKRLLPMLLQRKYPDFARVRYVVIDSIEGSGLDELPIQLKSKEQLAVIVRSEMMPIKVEEYTDIDELRTDIMEYRENPKIWLAGKTRRDKRRKDDQAFVEMNALNDDTTNVPTTLPPEKPISSIIDL